MKSFSAILPFPPSVNNLLLNVARGGRVKTAKDRAWEKEADACKPSGSVRDARTPRRPEHWRLVQLARRLVPGLRRSSFLRLKPLYKSRSNCTPSVDRAFL